MKLEIAVLFGCMSSEHSVSCMSAYNVIQNLDRNKYNVTCIGIDLEGNFLNYLGDLEKIKNNTWKEDFENIFKINNIFVYLKIFDVVFPVIHGKYAEDGAIQGILEFSNVKYVGCDVVGSSIGYDKILSKKLTKNINIDVVNYTSFTKYEDLKDEYIIEKLKTNKLKFPLFVKPNKEGSSYGVKKANNLSEIKEAVIYALTFDNIALVEEYVEDKIEVECAVLGNNELLISTPGQICSANEIYDFESKYANEKSYTKIPADLSIEKLNLIKEYSNKIFKTLQLKGLSRIDFFVTNNKIYFNEVNTMPGFTDISMYPMLMKHIGIEYNELLDKLIELALNR